MVHTVAYMWHFTRVSLKQCTVNNNNKTCNAHVSTNAIGFYHLNSFGMSGEAPKGNYKAW